MKTTVYYFTGTGNSLKTAKDIASKINPCDLVPIAGGLNENNLIADTEKIGFVFPLHYQTIPKIVENFIKKLKLSGVKYIFAVITKGVNLTGGALNNLNSLLINDKSTNLNYGAYVVMPQNCITILDVPSEKKQKIIFEKSINKTEKIANDILNKKYFIEKEPLAFMQVIKKTKLYKNNVYINDKNFAANKDCNSCDICRKICPVNNIKLVNGIPQWQHQCRDCLSCINFCPNNAIQYGKSTINKKKYHHPEITIKDIIDQKFYNTKS